MLSDDLKDTIWEYAHDYDLREDQRHTRWPDVAAALTDFEAAVRADERKVQIEKDAEIAVAFREAGQPLWNAALVVAAAALRAQLTEGETDD